MKGLQSKYDRKRKRSSNRATKTTNEIEEKKEDNKKKLEKTQEVDPEVVDLSLNPTQKKVFFVLDNAPLAKIQIKRGVWRVAHSEDDAAAIVRQKKKIDNFRSDIVHEALKGIIDSTLCKNGMVGGIFVETENGVLFQVKPHVRIPRTLPRFCGVMLELLDRSSVRANETNEKLFRVIEKPVTRHIPPNSHIIGISADSKKVVDIESHVSASDNDCNLVFVVGASPHGKINEGYVDNMISGTSYTEVSSVVDTYYMPLSLILASPLNLAGKVDTSTLKLRGEDCFECTLQANSCTK